MPEALKRGDLLRALLQAGIWAATGRTLGAVHPLFLRKDARGPLADLAMTEKMAPMVQAFLRHHGIRPGRLLDDAARVARILSGLLYDNLTPLVEEMGRRSIRCLLIKGSVLDLTVYDGLPRWMDDLDLLVNPDDLSAAERVFRRAGYAQGAFEPKRMRINKLTRRAREVLTEGHYEVPHYRRIVHVPALARYRETIQRYLNVMNNDANIAVHGGRIYVLLEYDLHFNVAHTFDLQDVWAEPRVVRLPGGVDMKAHGLTASLVFHAPRMYHEIFIATTHCLRQFIDVVALVQRYGAEIDWNRLLEAVDRYSLHPAFYYSLWHVNEILGGGVPPGVIERCKPTQPPADRGHDWGDFVPLMLHDVVVTPILGSTAAPTVRGG